MPTFKAGFVQPQPDKTDTENLAALTEAYNNLVQTLGYTLNHLDEENLNDSVLQHLTGQEGEHG